MDPLLRAVKDVERDLEQFKPLARLYRLTVLRRWINCNPAPNRTIREALSTFGKYNGSENLMVTLGNGAMTISPSFMQQILLNVAIDHGASYAVRALRRLLE